MLSAPLITGFGELMLEERVAVSRSQDPSQEEEETVRRKSSCVTADGTISEDSWHPQQRTNGREVWESVSRTVNWSSHCLLDQSISCRRMDHVPVESQSHSPTAVIFCEFHGWSTRRVRSPELKPTSSKLCVTRPHPIYSLNLSFPVYKLRIKK